MPAPDHRTATGDDAGRNCPYCRFPVKSGAPVIACGDCGAVQHDDCWVEGDGCAVVGCSGGPGAGRAGGGTSGGAGAGAASGAGAGAGWSGAAHGPGGPRAGTPTPPPPRASDRRAGPAPGAYGGPATGPHDAPASRDRSTPHDEPTLAHHAGGPAGSPWGAPPPPQAPSSRDRHGVLIASILVLAVAIVGSAAAVLLLSGGKDDGRQVAATTTRRDTPKADGPATAPPATTTADPASTAPTTDTTAQNPSAGGAGTSGGGGTTGGGLLSSTPFRGGGFLISPPAGWGRDSTEKLKGDITQDGFYETRWHPKGRPDVYVLVDRQPGSTDPPQAGAAKGRAARADAADYVEHTYRAVGGDWLWEFTTEDRRKYDRFSRSCDNGFAVLGAAPEGEAERWRPTFEAFAGSLRPTC